MSRREVEKFCKKPNRMHEARGNELIQRYLERNPNIKKIDISPYHLIKAGIENEELSFDESNNIVQASFKLNRSIFKDNKFILLVKVSGT